MNRGVVFLYIFNFDTKRKTVKKKLFFKKIKYEDYFDRENIKYNNMLFTIVKTSYDISDEDIFKFVRMFKGEILPGRNKEFNSTYKDFLFNINPYMKRAYLNSFKKIIENNGDVIPTVCIQDDCFKLCREYNEIAGKCKSLVILSPENKDVFQFQKNCFYEFGLRVYINAMYKVDEMKFSFDTRNIGEERGAYCFVDNNIIRFHPSKEYFSETNIPEKLIETGVYIDYINAVLNS